MARGTQTPSSSATTNVSRVAILAAVCLTVAALQYARVVLVPIALAAMFAFILGPVVTRLERMKLGRAPSVIIVATLGLGLFGGLAYLVYGQIEQLAADLPKYQATIDKKLQGFRGDGKGSWSTGTRTIERMIERATSRPTTSESAAESAAEAPVTRVQVVEERSQMPSVAALMPVFDVLGTMGIVVVFVFFMLMSRDDLRDRVIRLLSRNDTLTLTTQALDDAATRVSRYLLALSIVNGTYGVAIALGLLTIGATMGDTPFPNWILWGLLCAVLRFIPYIGPWIAASFPLLLSLAVYPTLGPFVAVLSMFVVIELVSNNVMEPWLYGSSTGVSAVAIMIAAVFWTWLWGPVGLLLSTPLTVLLAVVGKYVPQLSFLDVMLGDAQVLEPHQRFYQRLLSLDRDEAMEVVEAELEKGSSLESVYDAVVLPALALAEADRHRGQLDETREAFIRESLREMMSFLADRPATERPGTAAAVESASTAVGTSAATARPLGAEGLAGKAGPAEVEGMEVPSLSPAMAPLAPAGAAVRVLCLPAHDAGDELVAEMLAQALKAHGFVAIAITTAALASEMVALVDTHDADVVVISALPPGAVTHSRYLCKRLQQRFPELPLIVGLWTVKGELKQARQRIACRDSVKLLTTLSATIEAVRQHAQAIVLTSTSGSGPFKPKD